MGFNLEKAAALLLIVPDFKQCQTFGHTKTRYVTAGASSLGVLQIACRLDEAGSFLFGAVYLQHAKKTNKKTRYLGCDQKCNIYEVWLHSICLM